MIVSACLFTINKKNIAELSTKIDYLEERFVNGEISREQYLKFTSKYSGDINVLSEETRQAALVSSNLEKAIDKGLEIAAKLSTAWASGSFTERQTLQYLIFPDGILYNKKNNSFRTIRVHSLFAAIPLLADIIGKKETGNHQNDYLLSSSVGTTKRTNSL